MLTIEKPRLDMALAFLDMCDDYRASGDPGYAYADIQAVERKIGSDIAVEADPPPQGRLRALCFWFLDGGRIVGTSRLRPVLDARFERKGGHIGFDVRPSERKKGRATEILRLTLQKAREAGLGRVLLTCDEGNRGSAGAIEANGGRLEGLIQEGGRAIRRYWIDLDAPWAVLSRVELADRRIFTLTERRMRSLAGKEASFTVLEAPHWASVIPVVERDGRRFLLMVRQWRIGSGRWTIEFPGGMVEEGEEPAAGAARELREETGYEADRITRIGESSPNPAFMDNLYSVFLAEGCEARREQALDEHEEAEVLLVPEEEAVAHMGRGEFGHALMVAAMLYYLRWNGRVRGA